MIEAEYGVIGCILCNSDCLYDIYDKLKPVMFKYELASVCYESMLFSYETGKTINTVSISQELENRRYSSAEILEFLNTCIAQNVTSAMAVGYAETIINEYKSNTLREYIQRIDLTPGRIDLTIKDTIAQLEFLQTGKNSSVRTAEQVVDENRDKYFKVKARPGLGTGFYNLDQTLMGLEPGDVTVIGARPAVGKSALATFIMTNMINKKHKVGYFNLEMNEAQIFERMVVQQSYKIGKPIELTRLRRAIKFLGGEEEAYNAACNDLRKFNYGIVTGSKTVSQIRAEARHEEYECIIIDYLQLIKADKSYSNRASEVGHISKSIKEMAMELKVPVILLSQLNRVSEQNATKEPSMSELRESGDIEQDASNILLIWNASADDRTCKGLKIEKNRQGELAKIGLEFIGKHMTFIEHVDFDEFVKKSQKRAESAAELHEFEAMAEGEVSPFG